MENPDLSKPGYHFSHFLKNRIFHSKIKLFCIQNNTFAVKEKHNQKHNIDHCERKKPEIYLHHIPQHDAANYWPLNAISQDESQQIIHHPQIIRKIIGQSSTGSYVEKGIRASHKCFNHIMMDCFVGG